jgi:hypothetical protein
MPDVRIKKPDGTWISLKGPQGDPGPPGPPGADSTVAGPAGADGTDGRNVAVFEGASEPGSAVAGDYWFVP